MIYFLSYLIFILHFHYFKGNRPSVEALEDFLLRNRDWILPKLFNGASAEIVAHALVGMYMHVTNQTMLNIFWHKRIHVFTCCILFNNESI